MRLVRVVLVPLAAVAVLGGCGSTPDGADAAAGPASDTGGSAPAEGGDTCEQLAAQGITGASFGPVQALLPKEDTLVRIDETLLPLQAVPPAEEVAAEWATLQDYLEGYKAAAEALPPGGFVQDPAIFNPGEDIQSAQDTLTDWWFATCS